MRSKTRSTLLKLVVLVVTTMSFASQAQNAVATYYSADGNTSTIDNLPAKN